MCWLVLKISLKTCFIFQETFDDHTDRDFLDALLKAQLESEESREQLSDETIGHIVYELFGGGIESTTMTLLWFIVYMVRNPEVGYFQNLLVWKSSSNYFGY